MVFGPLRLLAVAGATTIPTGWTLFALFTWNEAGAFDAEFLYVTCIASAVILLGTWRSYALAITTDSTSTTFSIHQTNRRWRHGNTLSFEADLIIRSTVRIVFTVRQDLDAAPQLTCKVFLTVSVNNTIRWRRQAATVLAGVILIFTILILIARLWRYTVMLSTSRPNGSLPV